MTPQSLTPAEERRTNQHEERYREIKAQRLAAWMFGKLIDIASAQTDEEWQNSAAQAGVTVPSDTTKARVIQILRQRWSL